MKESGIWNDSMFNVDPLLTSFFDRDKHPSPKGSHSYPHWVLYGMHIKSSLLICIWLYVECIKEYQFTTLTSTYLGQMYKAQYQTMESS